MKCAICGIEVETIDEAIQQNWIPSFYEGEKEHGPVCASCAETMIGMGEDGEMELKTEYRGKVRYVNRDYGGKPKKEDLVIEIFMTEEVKQEKH
jgi:ribosomal protein L34E